MNGSLLSTAYLGNIEYYSLLLSGARVVIEQHENYQKQSFRNRCDIMTANGVASLTIPVVKNSGAKTPIKDLRIDYSKTWQHQHWNSIISAYRNSPYFDYFEDDFAPFYHKHFDFLWDFNTEIQALVFDLLKVNPQIEYSSEYIIATDSKHDFRESLSPKPRLSRNKNQFIPTPYYQVFAEKHPFAPNLSIVDMLFCEGKFI